MKIEHEHDQERARRLAAGQARRSRRHFRSLVLGWTDPDSGERLTARIHGGEELLPGLVRQGFELLSSDESSCAHVREVLVFTQLAGRERGASGGGGASGRGEQRGAI